MARRAASAFAVGKKAVFGGYSEEPETPILTKGEVVEIIREGKDEGGSDVKFVRSVEQDAEAEEMCYPDELAAYTDPKPRQGGGRGRRAASAEKPAEAPEEKPAEAPAPPVETPVEAMSEALTPEEMGEDETAPAPAQKPAEKASGKTVTITVPKEDKELVYALLPVLKLLRK